MNIEKNYLRRSYRINLPAKVIINNHTFMVKDWSFLGFRIEFENENNEIKPNEIYPITFELPFVNFNMSFNAKAICKWKKGNEAGFEFEELSDDIKLLMKEYVEAFVEGRLQEENGLLKIANGLEIPISTDLPITEEEESFLNKKLIKNIFLIIFFIIIAAIIGYIIYLNRNSIYSQDAFVSGKTFYVKSSVEGEISNLNVSLLQKIHKNNLIATISNKKLKLEIKNLKQEISKIKDYINKLNQSLLLQKNIIDKEFSQKKQQIDTQKNNLKTLIKTKTLLLKKLQQEYKLGIVHIVDIETLKQEILNLKNQLKSLYYPVKNYSSLLPIKGMIITQQKTLLNLQNNLKQLKFQKKYFYIYSPVNGKILNIYVKNKEWIKKDALIITIQTHSKGYVIARYSLKQVQKINIGDRAEIYIPALGKTYKGIVSSMGKNALKSNSIFSESNFYSQQDVPIKIKILDKNNLNDGIFAEVAIDIK